MSYNAQRDTHPMRKPVIAANWKMYKTPAEARAFVAEFLKLAAGPHPAEVILCPSMTALGSVVEAVGTAPIAVGAQNMYYAEEGAFTGETSPLMLRALGVTHVILGHSERRQFFCETDELVNKKLISALAHGLTPIVCVGELEEERNSGKTEEVIDRQVSIALSEITPEQTSRIIFAYEPVWAIGTGHAARPSAAAEEHAMIRNKIAALMGQPVAEVVRILYGGSVSPENAAGLLSQTEIDGALIGSASLQAESFVKILKS